MRSLRFAAPAVAARRAQDESGKINGMVLGMSAVDACRASGAHFLDCAFIHRFTPLRVLVGAVYDRAQSRNLEIERGQRPRRQFSSHRRQPPVRLSPVTERRRRDRTVR